MYIWGFLNCWLFFYGCFHPQLQENKTIAVIYYIYYIARALMAENWNSGEFALALITDQKVYPGILMPK